MPLTKADKAEVAAMIARGVIAATPVNSPGILVSSSPGDRLMATTIVGTEDIEEAALNPNTRYAMYFYGITMETGLSQGYDPDSPIVTSATLHEGTAPDAKHITFCFPPNRPEHLAELKRLQDYHQVPSSFLPCVSFLETDDGPRILTIRLVVKMS